MRKRKGSTTKMKVLQYRDTKASQLRRARTSRKDGDGGDGVGDTSNGFGETGQDFGATGQDMGMGAGTGRLPPLGANEHSGLEAPGAHALRRRQRSMDETGGKGSARGPGPHGGKGMNATGPAGPG